MPSPCSTPGLSGWRASCRSRSSEGGGLRSQGIWFMHGLMLLFIFCSITCIPEQPVYHTSVLFTIYFCLKENKRKKANSLFELLVLRRTFPMVGAHVSKSGFLHSPNFECRFNSCSIRTLGACPHFVHPEPRVRGWQRSPWSWI